MKRSFSCICDWDCGYGILSYFLFSYFVQNFRGAPCGSVCTACQELWYFGYLQSVGAESLFVSCLMSQQHASVSQGWICSDNFMCCHTQIEVADPTFHLTQSQYTDTKPTSPSTDPVMPGRVANWVPIFKSLVDWKSQGKWLFRSVGKSDLWSRFNAPVHQVIDFKGFSYLLHSVLLTNAAWYLSQLCHQFVVSVSK